MYASDTTRNYEIRTLSPRGPRGIEYETGHASLFGRPILVNNAEEIARDQMLYIERDDDLKQSAPVRFDGRFKVDRLYHGISSEQLLLRVVR